jgi:hypothetical protein
MPRSAETSDRGSGAAAVRVSVTQKSNTRLPVDRADCGYYDQAHLLRDFRELAGSPPSRLLGSEGALARAFVDPARLARFFARTA